MKRINRHLVIIVLLAMIAVAFSAYAQQRPIQRAQQRPQMQAQAQRDVEAAQGAIATQGLSEAAATQQRADAAATAADMNRADALNSLLGGFAGAAGSVARGAQEAGGFGKLFKGIFGNKTPNSGFNYGKTVNPIGSYKRRGE